MLTKIDQIAPINLISKGSLKTTAYYSLPKKDDAILHARKNLLLILAHYLATNKPVVFEYSEGQELTNDNGEYSTVVNIDTYYLNPLDCEIGDRFRLEQSDNLPSSYLELDHDCYHFKKIDDSAFIWERVI